MDLTHQHLLLLVVLFGLIFITLLPQKTIQDSRIAMFRIFFPSWRFYENIAHIPHLFYQMNYTGGGKSDWIRLPTKLSRGTLSLWFNPQGNMTHAQNTLLDQFFNDIQKIDPKKSQLIEKETSYLLVKNMVSSAILAKPSSSVTFQFKLKVSLHGEDKEKQEDIFVSRLLQLEEPK